MENLVTVPEVIDIIENSTEVFGVESIDFREAAGRILAEDIFADRDFPPFNRMSMDGIAINYAAIEKGIKSFKIEGVQSAGKEQMTLSSSDNCIEAMTGAVLPKNADTVIQYEWLDVKDGVASLNLDAFEIENLSKSKNVHAKGKDKSKGAVLISKGLKLSSADLGVLATVGKNNVLVQKNPTVMIVSTGDELVEVNETPKDHQIRRSNVWTMFALLKENGIEPETAHIVDDKVILKEKIKHFLEIYDVLMFSGAVSKGKFDFLPEILEALGVKKKFHRVQQRPGKPFWFGKKDATTIFAFPGNPISTYVGCVKYFLPWYRKSLGLEENVIKMAVLAKDFSFKPNLHYFLTVSIAEDDLGTRFAYPEMGNGSGDLANLSKADGFLELPTGKTDYYEGESFPVIMYRKD